MRAKNRKARVLAGVFVITTIAWTIDMFTGAEPVKSADAAELVAHGGAVRIADPADRTLLDRFLFEEHSHGQPITLAAAGRDPFQPDETFAQAAARHTADVDGTGTDAHGQSAPASAPARPPFEARHRLGGVVLGKRPIALVDDRTYAVGDMIEEMKLIAIQRDYILLRGPDGEVRLNVPRAGGIQPATNHPPNDSSP